MNSRKGVSKGKDVEDGDDGQWKVISRKPNKNKTSSVKQHSYRSASGSSRPSSDPKRPNARPVHVSPPLQNGWNWQSRNHKPKDDLVAKPKDDLVAKPKDDLVAKPKDDVDNDYDSDALDYDDDELLSDEFDSDSSDKSHNTLKKSKWFAKFFKIIDELKVEEVNDPERQWHCPACQAGPGAIDWYHGLQPLMRHAKSKGGDRMKLHRKLAQLLEEELKRKGTSVIPSGEAFGRWKVLQEDEKDRQIVWPPMVVVMNTQLEQNEYDKWIGMGNPELLEYFSAYRPAKARHSYGPQGHRGMSVLIFESSARGYFDAERLHKNFESEGVDRNAWMSHRCNLFYHGGKRLLYGYLATKEDLDIFNQHSQGKSKLKYEMQSYRDMVVNQIWQMSEDNQQLGWYKDKLIQEKRYAKAVEESFLKASQKFQQAGDENRIILQRSKIQHEEDREEMLQQEEFFSEQMKAIHESRKAKEESFERSRQEGEKVKQTSNAKERSSEMEEYTVQRDILTKAHEEEMNAMRKRHWEEEVVLEEKFNNILIQLKEKYSPL